MKNFVIKKCLNLISQNKKYSNIKLAEIKYGLESIYLLITKCIIIFTVAFLLGLFKELIAFLIFYNVIKMPSFGLHATKSWICLVSSLFIFLLIPYLCTIIIFNKYLLFILGVICTISLFKNAPADTYKRPIINKNRRTIYKLLTTLFSIIYVIVALCINDVIIQNMLVWSLILQAFMTSPLIYTIFKLPYNNYKTYQNRFT